MVPKMWPEGLIYATESVPVELPSFLLESFLCTGNLEDLEKKSWVIEEKKIHPLLQVQEITPSFTIDGQIPHPLSHQKTREERPHYGVFASEKINAGSEIGEYIGEIYLANDEKSLQALLASAPSSSYAWLIKINGLFLLIDAQNIANEMALINDFRGIGSNANVRIRPLIHKGVYHFGYVAVCDIQKGEEVLADYGRKFWSPLS